MSQAKRFRAACVLITYLLGAVAWSTRAQDPAPATTPTTTPARDPAGAAAPQTAPVVEFQTTESGLRFKITTPAPEPPAAQNGDWVSVHYTGKLENGQPFDTSLRLAPEGRFMVMKPFTFKLGEKRVIAGWEEGVLGMRVGEKRTLVIPPELAYGKTGAGGGLIPPDATLVFEVELIGLYRPAPEAPTTPAQ